MNLPPCVVCFAPVYVPSKEDFWVCEECMARRKEAETRELESQSRKRPQRFPGVPSTSEV